MSLTTGLRSPHSPLRRFLDRELSAGPSALRQNFRAQHRADHILLPPPGVGTEAGTVGTAIDQRLRLAFTAAAPVDDAALIGIELIGEFGANGVGLRMRAVGKALAARLTATVRSLDLDNRTLPMDRAQDEEEDLARMLITATWYQVLARTTIGFAYTPLAKATLKDPDGFTLARLLALPHPDLVDDVVNQLHHAARSPLEDLRTRTRPEDCHGGPTFASACITADADLVVDGFLLDFKSTRHPHNEMSQRTAWQLTGYLLLDATDTYRIDTLGLYLTRTGALTSWPVEDFLDLLGTCRRDLTELRRLFNELLTGCHGYADAPYLATQEQVDRIRRLLERLAPVAGPGCCPVCLQALLETCYRRTFCTTRCRTRAQTLRNRGLMPGGPRPLLPGPRPDLAENAPL
ncbi:hypothetical protein E6R18_01525 [Streptomyces sp. A1277]|uniref:hypothetical protein n=1 Tax=Streptomyces sp. A1277 TaxID=2563103 RepID=UPI0010A29E2F|nr:hypothetical protein [Streptomyces sp. A1277]THA36065.1 hypothetical protein E6R18_01525 [Streptomyces sp. A1277]